MAISVILPNALRPHAAGNDRVPLEATTVGDALEKLIQRYPPLGAHVPEFAGQGNAIYRNGTQIQKLQGLETALVDGDTITIIIPAGDL